MTDERSTPSDPSGNAPASSGADDRGQQTGQPSGSQPGTPPRDRNRDPEIVREISMEEFQPKGTLTLALIYFVIIVLMWIFMYFFEFAGNDPSILG